MSRQTFPLRLDAGPFCLGIQPNCLNVVSHSESGLLQAKGFALSPRARRRCDCSPLWFHFAVVTAPIVFLKHNKPNRCPRDEWQHMVLSETRGLWLCSIVREGIGLIRRLACVKPGLTSTVDTSPRNRASQEPTVTARKWFPGAEQTLSQPSE